MEPTLEDFFASFRSGIIGQHQTFASPFGPQTLLYADWTASGRAYGPIEACIQSKILPFVANTHTESTLTGQLMSEAYAQAKEIIKHHVRANSDDVLLFCGSGMTAAVNKLQRILGLRLPERLMDYVRKENPLVATQVSHHELPISKPLGSYPGLDEALTPVVFVTHMEHHSNQISWLETIATVEIIPPDDAGQVDLVYFSQLLDRYQDRKTKIAAITACSNVTGIQTPYHAIAQLMHQHGGLCFVDFACSAPYVDINMHPSETGAHLDAIYFSPHKFLGGPGSAGVLIFNQQLYRNAVPDQPGGGTVVYTNPWQQHLYAASIEGREDGGTPPILQGIKAALCIRLKEAMGVERMQEREAQLLQLAFERFSAMPQVHVLAEHQMNRLGIFSFLIDGVPYNLAVKLLNDRFGIQTRGGCSCAGTYGHFLLGVSKAHSERILGRIQAGDLQSKPGWVRLSIHPTMTNAEVSYLLDAIEWTAAHRQQWMLEYHYERATNAYYYKEIPPKPSVDDWFSVAHWGATNTGG